MTSSATRRWVDWARREAPYAAWQTLVHVADSLISEYADERAREEFLRAPLEVEVPEGEAPYTPVGDWRSMLQCSGRTKTPYKILFNAAVALRHSAEWRVF